MDYKVVFSPTAIRDLADSVSYISRVDSEAAARIGDAMIDAAERLLSSHPFIGPKCPEYANTEVRYWLYRNYRIVYEITESRQTVDVLRFWHCSRGDWPVDLNSEQDGAHQPATRRELKGQ
jgi:plasmid stabilization system protein ParE